MLPPPSPSFYFLILKINLLIDWFGCIGSLLLRAGFSLVASSGGYSLLRCVGFSLRWLLLLQSTGSRHVGFRSCGKWAQQLWLAGSRAQAQELWRTGLVALRQVGSSWTRARTRVPCIDCATREVLEPFLIPWRVAFFCALCSYKCIFGFS